MRYSSLHRQGLMEGRRADGTAVYVEPPTLAEAERDERECARPINPSYPMPATREDFAP